MKLLPEQIAAAIGNGASVGKTPVRDIAAAIGVATDAPLAEMADRVANIGLSRFRGERLEIGDGIVLVNDCYNANPVSMRAALSHLASIGEGRRIAVLGEMAEHGPGATGFRGEIGERARAGEVGLREMLGPPGRGAGGESKSEPVRPRRAEEGSAGDG